MRKDFVLVAGLILLTFLATSYALMRDHRPSHKVVKVSKKEYEPATYFSRHFFPKPLKSGPVLGQLLDKSNSYSDSRKIWPLQPLYKEHPVRGSFWDPRGHPPYGSFHQGIDIAVDERKPEKGVPEGSTHRVYAMESGIVELDRDAGNARCGAQIIRAGHFEYWHVRPALEDGDYVNTGEVIGYNCKNYWHIHLNEMKFEDSQMIYVNPLRRQGKIAPYTDTLPPQVEDVEFFRPENSLWRQTPEGLMKIQGQMRPLKVLSGPVDVRAKMQDPQSFQGFLGKMKIPGLLSRHHPYKAHLSIEDSRGKVIYSAYAWQADHVPIGGVNHNHYAPNTLRYFPTSYCLAVRKKGKPCLGQYWFHMYASANIYEPRYLDTTQLADGYYKFTVTAYDLYSNKASMSRIMLVQN